MDTKARHVPKLEDLYLVYVGGQFFKSRLAFGIDKAFYQLIDMIYGAAPLEGSEEFDELVSIRNDFDNESFWTEGGSLWETDFSTGFVVVVKVESRLN